MSRCDQELCPQWTGSGCVCEVLDIEQPERCQRCGRPTDLGECDLCDFESAARSEQAAMDAECPDDIAAQVEEALR
jgi:hypothetical protein